MSASTPSNSGAVRGALDELLRDTAKKLTSLEGGPEAAVVGVRAASGEVSLGAAGHLRGNTIQDVPLDAVFDLASVSKVLGTTAAVLALHGELDLDRPVTDYVPQSNLPQSVTPRHLLLHRAGLWDWQPLYLASHGAAAALDELPLRYPVGTERHYSDLGFMHLGRIVAAVAGEDYPHAVTRLVLEPLGMSATTVGGSAAAQTVPSATGDDVERRMVAQADPYPIVIAPRRTTMQWRTELVQGAPNDGNAFHGHMVGHAGLFAPVSDMLRGAAALMGEQHQAAAVAPSNARAAARAAGPDAGQALGWRHEVFSGIPLWWHPGFTGCAVGVGQHAAIALGSNRLLGRGEHAPRPTAQLWGYVIERLVDAGVLRGEER